MSRITAEGQRELETIAARHAIPGEVALELFQAVVRGGGSMAQFNIPSLGGSGQWMRGGMTMVGDMFNQSLKAKVDSLCDDLARLAATRPFERELPPASQSQSQTTGNRTSVAYGYREATAQGNWWPEELGSPTATGSQNEARYAYFPAIQRLAVDVQGKLSVYDSGDHRITGFGQQQGKGGSMTFTSQHGLVSLSSLPRIESAKTPKTESLASDREYGSETRPAAVVEKSSKSMTHDEILATIERLAAMQKKGHLTEAEYQSKKAELLARL